MKITLLGTGSPLPSATCAGPSTLVQAGGQNIVVDAGRGVIMRLVGAMCPPPFISAVILTHLHSDHICDLNDIITTRWISSPAATPLPIYGPKGTQKMIDGLLAMLSQDETYRLNHHDDLRAAGGMKVEVHEVEAGESFNIGDVTVSVHATDHRPKHSAADHRSLLALGIINFNLCGCQGKNLNCFCCLLLIDLTTTIDIRFVILPSCTAAQRKNTGAKNRARKSIHHIV